VVVPPPLPPQLPRKRANATAVLAITERTAIEEKNDAEIYTNRGTHTASTLDALW
jgi:hypothetical protein